MKTDLKIAQYWYGELIEGLRLIASDFSVQEQVLPDFVHLPDEVLNAIPIDSLDTLQTHGLVSKEQLIEVQIFDQSLEAVTLPPDYEAMIDMMKNGDEFNAFRTNAKILLEKLGQRYEKPKINAIYVKGP